MAALRWPLLFASAWSWVTRMVVMPSERCSWRNSTWSCSRSLRSSAPSGSSVRITGGCATRARARATRTLVAEPAANGERAGDAPANANRMARAVFGLARRVVSDGAARGGERALSLDLPLARRAVEAHGGTIALVSEPGMGTLVTIDLRREP